MIGRFHDKEDRAVNDLQVSSRNVFQGRMQAQVASVAPECDSILVRRAKRGSAADFGELYQRHRMRIYRAALRILHNEHDAEDAVQRAFERAFAGLSRFRETSAFSTWMTRIVINESLMQLRQRKSSQRYVADSDSTPDEVVLELRANGSSPEEMLSESERREALFEAVGQLRHSLRAVIHRELQGLTNAETAQMLGLTVTAVKARTHHARKFLRKHFERKFAGTATRMMLEA
jgi:RNA polymerase sigma-70 factor, ECF subfamily